MMLMTLIQILYNSEKYMGHFPEMLNANCRKPNRGLSRIK